MLSRECLVERHHAISKELWGENNAKMAFFVRQRCHPIWTKVWSGNITISHKSIRNILSSWFNRKQPRKKRITFSKLNIYRNQFVLFIIETWYFVIHYDIGLCGEVKEERFLMWADWIAYNVVTYIFNRYNLQNIIIHQWKSKIKINVRNGCSECAAILLSTMNSISCKQNANNHTYCGTNYHIHKNSLFVFMRSAEIGHLCGNVVYNVFYWFHVRMLIRLIEMGCLYLALNRSYIQIFFITKKNTPIWYDQHGLQSMAVWVKPPVITCIESGTMRMEKPAIDKRNNVNSYQILTTSPQQTRFHRLSLCHPGNLCT